MYVLIIMFLIMSALVMPLIAKISGGAARPVVQPIRQPVQQPVVAKNNIISQLDSLLEQKIIDDAWYKAINDLVLDLVPIDKALSLQYLQKIQDKTAQVAAAKAVLSVPVPISVPSPAPVVKEPEAAMPVFPKSKAVPPKQITAPATMARKTIQELCNEIVAQLDEKLRSTTIDDAWYAHVNDLIFDLAALDRNLSQEYLKKIRIKTTPIAVPQPVAPAVVPQPAASTAEPMKRGTPPPPPLLRPSTFGQASADKGFGGQASGGAMKKGSPPPASGGMKQGTPPPPPILRQGFGGQAGPMKKGEKKAPAQKGQAAPAGPKAPEPLTIKESYGARQLEKRSTEEITELFNKLLDALGTHPDFWDAVKKEPKLDWNNKISTVKKALSDPKRNVAINTERMIKDRIQHVKAEKAQQGLQKQEAAEQGQKKEEGYSEEELVSEIEQLMKAPKAEDQLWLLRFMANVKNMNKINPEKAAQYEAEFLKKFPGKKPFLPKKKP